MPLVTTRVLVLTAVFTANLALSLSAGTAKAQPRHHTTCQTSRQHTLQMEGSSGIPTDANAMIIDHDKPVLPDSADKGFCGFSGANAC